MNDEAAGGPATAGEGKNCDRHILLLRRKGCGHSDRAERFLRLLFGNVTTVESSGPGERIPAELLDRPVDVILAFRSHIIVRPEWLAKASISLNFHPGPPERPGTGCINFALFEADERYGSTCHYMDEGIDSGPIVDVRYFAIHPADDVASVLERTYDYMLCQFYDVVQRVAEGVRPAPLPVSWGRTATRKRDMDQLREVRPDVDAGTLVRQIRATSFGPYRPFITLHGRRFTLDSDDGQAG